MNRKWVNSSALDSVGYDPETQTLEVKYPRGAVVQHKGVPQEFFDRLMAAKSAGGFYSAFIRNQFEHVYVSDE